MSTAGPPTGNGIVLNETIHQATRLRIMTVLVSVSESDRLAYGFIQETLGPHRREPDHPPPQAPAGGLCGNHQGVPRLQAAHLGPVNR